MKYSEEELNAMTRGLNRNWCTCLVGCWQEEKMCRKKIDPIFAIPPDEVVRAILNEPRFIESENNNEFS